MVSLNLAWGIGRLETLRNAMRGKYKIFFEPEIFLTHREKAWIFHLPKRFFFLRYKMQNYQSINDVNCMLKIVFFFNIKQEKQKRNQGLYSFELNAIKRSKTTNFMGWIIPAISQIFHSSCSCLLSLSLCLDIMFMALKQPNQMRKSEEEC